MKKSEAKKHLKSLNEAIAKLEADPTLSFSLSTPGGGSRSVSFQNLATLYKEREQLETKLARARNPQGFTMGYPSYQ